ASCSWKTAPCNSTGRRRRSTRCPTPTACAASSDSNGAKRAWCATRWSRSAQASRAREFPPQRVAKLHDKGFFRTAASHDQRERRLIAERGRRQRAQAPALDPRLREMLGQKTDVRARQDQDQLPLHAVDRCLAALESLAREFRLAPVRTAHHPLLADHLGRHAALAEQRMTAAAIEPVLLAMQCMIDKPVHADRKRTDRHVEPVAKHAQL